MNIQLTRRNEQAVSTWAGGETTELCIRPTSASCPERNFDFRVSSATVELAESTFSDFSGYTRHIMPLEGSMELWHNGAFAVKLRPYEAHTFDGSWQTRSLGTCVDFNLIHAPNLTGTVQVVRDNQHLTPVTNGHTGLYACCDGLVVSGSGFTHSLNTGDFLLFECDTEVSPVHLEGPENTTVLAIVVTVQHS